MPDFLSLPAKDCKRFKGEILLQINPKLNDIIYLQHRTIWPNPKKMKKEIFSTFCRKVKWSKRYVVWESTRVISFYLSVCYCKWWRHHIDGLNHIEWGNFQNYLLSFIPFFFQRFFCKEATWGFVYCGLWESYVGLIYGAFSLKDHIFIIDQNSTVHRTAPPFVTLFWDFRKL